MAKVEVLTLYCAACCSNKKLMSLIRQQSKPFRIVNATKTAVTCHACKINPENDCKNGSCKRNKQMALNYQEMVKLFGNVQIPLLAFPDDRLVTGHNNVRQALEGKHTPLIKSKNIQEKAEYYEILNLPLSANLADVRYYFRRLQTQHKDHTTKEFKKITEAYNVLNDFLN